MCAATARSQRQLGGTLQGEPPHISPALIVCNLVTTFLPLHNHAGRGKTAPRDGLHSSCRRCSITTTRMRGNLTRRRNPRSQRTESSDEQSGEESAEQSEEDALIRKRDGRYAR